MKKYNIAWEELDGYGYTQRLMIYGGWLVRTFSGVPNSAVAHQIFIKDENHEWILEDGDKE